MSFLTAQNVTGPVYNILKKKKKSVTCLDLVLCCFIQNGHMKHIPVICETFRIIIFLVQDGSLEKVFPSWYDMYNTSYCVDSL